MLLENASIVASIPCRHKHSPSFYHSFGVTRDYVVFVEQPLYVDEMDKVGSCGNDNGKNGHLAGTGVHNNLRWKKTEMVYVYLIEKKSPHRVLPTVYTCEPFFFFHVVNAFQVEEDKYVFLDVVAYKDAEILSDLKFSHIERTDHVPTAKPIRIQLPLQQADDPVSITVVHAYSGQRLIRFDA